jgi:rRNA 2'-O-methyltransferase fibrillarin
MSKNENDEKDLNAIKPDNRINNLYIINKDKDKEYATLNIYEDESNDHSIINNNISYRKCDPHNSNFCAGIENGIKNIYMELGGKVLYLGAYRDPNSIFHISNIVGENGTVYGVEIDNKKGEIVKDISKKRNNIRPIINDARHASFYKNLIPDLVDCIYSDLAEPDDRNILVINAKNHLKEGGGFVFCFKFDNENEKLKIIQFLKDSNFSCKELVTLEPFSDHFTMITGIYKPIKKEQKENK